MKKGFFILLLFVLILPVIVNAEVCDNSKIYIDNIEIEDISNSDIEKSDASFKNNEIDLDLNFEKTGDFVIYKVLLKNDSNEDYRVDKSSLNINNDYISYELVDDNIVVKAGTEEEVFIKVQYKNAVPDSAFTNGVYDDNVSISLGLNNKTSILTNPLTKSNLYIIISIICVIGLTTYMIITKKKMNANIMLLASIFILPIGVSAMCSTSFTLNSNVEIVKRCNNLFVTEYGSFSEDEDVKTLCVDNVFEDSFVYKSNTVVYIDGETIKGYYLETHSNLFNENSYIKVYYDGDLIKTIKKNDLVPDWYDILNNVYVSEGYFSTIVFPGLTNRSLFSIELSDDLLDYNYPYALSAYTRNFNDSTHSSSWVDDKSVISKLRLLNNVDTGNGLTFTGYYLCDLANYDYADNIYCARFESIDSRK